MDISEPRRTQRTKVHDEIGVTLVDLAVFGDDPLKQLLPSRPDHAIALLSKVREESPVKRDEGSLADVDEEGNFVPAPLGSLDGG